MAIDAPTAVSGLGTDATFESLMKRLQPQKVVERLWELQYAFLSMVKKRDDFVGSQIDVPLEHSHPYASRTFASAGHGASGYAFPSSSVKYNLTRKKDYGIGRLDAETMHAARNDMGAWVRALQRESTNVLKTLQKRTAIALYRNSGGAIGKMSSVTDGDGTNDILVLDKKSDVVNFSIGQSLDFSTADGTSGSLLAQTSGKVLVRRLDFDNGYVYIGSDLDTAADYDTIFSSGEAETEYIFNVGDFGASCDGLEAWVPLTAPSAGESFNGIDRSVNIAMLAGHRLNDTSMSLEEMVQELAARIVYSGGSDLTCFMAPIQVKQFALELDTKVVRDPGGKGRTGFRGIVVDTVAGPIEVIGDPACPENRMFLLDMSTWCLHHLEPLPHLVKDDGLARTRVSDADQVEFRYRLWFNLACTAPGRNGVAALAAAL